MKFKSILTSLALILSCKGAMGVEYKAYINERYGYAISYPSAIVNALPEPDAGDGREFRAVNNTAKFNVSAGWNMPELHETSAGIALEAERGCQDHKATYRVVKPSLVAVSCFIGADVNYQKTVITPTKIITFTAKYPKTQRLVWDSVVTRMARSLKALRVSY